MTKTLTIPGRLTKDVADWPEASAEYAMARDLSNEGYTTFPSGYITVQGEVVARISYNAKVWPADFTAPMVALFDPEA